MVQPWRTGMVTRIENETNATRRYWIQVSELERFDFIPGQFVTLDLPIHEKVNKRWRSYSIASWPDGTNTFELVIVLLDGGAGTTYIFNEITVGSTFTLRGPQGVFVLPQEIERDIFLICTGTGVAPFRSMVNYIKLHEVQHKNIYLLFGCRKKSDLLYGEELKELDASFPSFHYLPTFSREEPGDHLSGYVHSVYEDICMRSLQPAANGEPPKPMAAHFYLCGWKNMIDEAKLRIQKLGYDKKSIHQELYG